MPNPLRLATKLALLFMLAAPLASAQGPGGPGGRGGWGGPGGGGTSPTALVQMPVVQDEVKMTDKQKAQIKQIKESADKKRVQVQDNAQKVATATRLQAAQEAAAITEANGGTPVAPNANGNGNNGGGRGGRGNRNDPASQAMRQTMDNFDAEVETALLKAIDAKQRTRVKQIALQAEGAGAFNNPEVIEKLGLSEEQISAIDAIRNDSRQSGRQLFGQLFNNGNNNGGGPGGGGPGGPGWGRPDPATFQTPEFQAKLKTVEESSKKLDDQTMANVGKALTKAQRTTFNKMIGEKFDVAQLRQGMFNRFRPAGTPATPPVAQASAAIPATVTTTAAPATPAAKPAARKSLRESRGGASQP